MYIVWWKHGIAVACIILGISSTTSIFTTSAVMVPSLSSVLVKCWNSNSMGMRGYIKEGLELTPMSSFNVEQGGVNSRPDSHGVLEWVRADGPGFSLCAAPLESSGPGFQSGVRRLDERAEVQGYTRPEMVEKIDSEGRS